MTDLFDQIASTRQGRRELASAELREEVLTILFEALERSGMTQAQLAERLGYRRSAVNQVFGGTGNVRVNTIGDYLHELGFGLSLKLTNGSASDEPWPTPCEAGAVRFKAPAATPMDNPPWPMPVVDALLDRQAELVLTG